MLGNALQLDMACGWGCPAPPACMGSKLAWLVGPTEIAIVDLATQLEVTRLQEAVGGVVDMKWSTSGR